MYTTVLHSLKCITPLQCSQLCEETGTEVVNSGTSCNIHQLLPGPSNLEEFEPAIFPCKTVCPLQFAGLAGTEIYVNEPHEQWFHRGNVSTFNRINQFAPTGCGKYTLAHRRSQLFRIYHVHINGRYALSFITTSKWTTSLYSVESISRMLFMN
jgi:hypothetical protein